MPAVHVTEAESAILEVLWRHGPLPPSRLISEVQALVDRLFAGDPTALAAFLADSDGKQV